jgi:hypothetical protein
MVTCVFFSTFLIFLHFSLLYFVFIYSCPLFNLVAFLVVKNFAVFLADSDTAQTRQSATNGCINFYPYSLNIVVRHGKRAKREVWIPADGKSIKITFCISDFKSLHRLLPSWTCFVFITPDRKDEWKIRKRQASIECFTYKMSNWFS